MSVKRSKNSDRLLVILPEKQAYKVVKLTHPRNGKCDFAVVQPNTSHADESSISPENTENLGSTVYELIKMNNESAAMTKDYVYAELDVVVGLKIPALFLVLSVLFGFQDRGLTSDLIREFAEFDFKPTDYECVCDLNENLYKLNTDKLKEYLDNFLIKLEPCLPSNLINRVSTRLGANPAPELAKKASKYATYQYICSSWLSKEVAEWYAKFFNFHDLETEIERIYKLNNLQTADIAAKSENIDSAPKKRAIPNKTKDMKPRNNKSLLDMFKKK